jgi:hypothetical protein
MSDDREQEIIHNLILARELRRQGPSWNRAFRRELWRRLGARGTEAPNRRRRRLTNCSR